MLGITRFTSRDNRKLKKISQYIAILLQISEPILRGFSSVIRFAYEWNALPTDCGEVAHCGEYSIASPPEHLADFKGAEHSSGGGDCDASASTALLGPKTTKPQALCRVRGFAISG